MQVVEQNAVERVRAQTAALLVARVMGVTEESIGPIDRLALEPLVGLRATKDLIAHLRGRPRRRAAESYAAVPRLRPELTKAGSPWHARLARFRTVSDIRPPLRGPRYAWCYRKYSPR